MVLSVAKMNKLYPPYIKLVGGPLNGQRRLLHILEPLGVDGKWPAIQAWELGLSKRLWEEAWEKMESRPS